MKGTQHILIMASKTSRALLSSHRHIPRPFALHSPFEMFPGLKLVGVMWCLACRLWRLAPKAMWINYWKRSPEESQNSVKLSAILAKLGNLAIQLIPIPT